MPGFLQIILPIAALAVGAGAYHFLVKAKEHASARTAKRIIELGGEIGIERFGVVGNRIASRDQAAWIVNQLDPDLVIGMVPYSELILEADLKQVPLISILDTDFDLRACFESIYRACIERD